jgi:eukaryotic-like serine/threonine-protein kinase
MDEEQPNSRAAAAPRPQPVAARPPIAVPRNRVAPKPLPGSSLRATNHASFGAGSITSAMSAAAATGAFPGSMRSGPAKVTAKAGARGFISGAFIGEAYQYERVLAEGGMSIVVAARYIPANKRVAIKLLKPEMLTDRELMSRFAREARTAPRIKSRYCVKILDASADEKRGPFMVMEFLQGRGLRNLIDLGPIALPTAVDFIGQVCDALASAHRLGIVHRDIKPENIFLVRDGDEGEEVRVLDFGISKVAASLPGSAGAESLVATSAVLGSPLYMSPEQMRASTKLDARTDVWSLGVTLYEMLYGKPPFVAVTFAELCAQVLSSDAPQLGELCPALPRAATAAVMKALSRDPELRYRTIVDFAVALLPFASVKGRVQIEQLAAEYGVSTPKRVPGAKRAGVASRQTAAVAAPAVRPRNTRVQQLAPVSENSPSTPPFASAAVPTPDAVRSGNPPRAILLLPLALLCGAGAAVIALRGQAPVVVVGGSSVSASSAAAHAPDLASVGGTSALAGPATYASVASESVAASSTVVNPSHAATERLSGGTPAAADQSAVLIQLPQAVPAQAPKAAPSIGGALGPATSKTANPMVGAQPLPSSAPNGNDAVVRSTWGSH